MPLEKAKLGKTFTKRRGMRKSGVLASLSKEVPSVRVEGTLPESLILWYMIRCFEVPNELIVN